MQAACLGNSGNKCGSALIPLCRPPAGQISARGHLFARYSLAGGRESRNNCSHDVICRIGADSGKISVLTQLFRRTRTAHLRWRCAAGSLVGSFDHSIVNSLARSFIRSIDRWLVYSFDRYLVHSFAHSLLRSAVRSIDRWLIYSFDCYLVHSFARSLVCSFTRLLIRSFALPSVRPLVHLLAHSTSIQAKKNRSALPIGRLRKRF